MSEAGGWEVALPGTDEKTIQRNHCEGISRETESESAARWSEF